MRHYDLLPALGILASLNISAEGMFKRLEKIFLIRVTKYSKSLAWDLEDLGIVE
jgi:hypothetical protein